MYTYQPYQSRRSYYGESHKQRKEKKKKKKTKLTSSSDSIIFPMINSDVFS